MERKRKQLQALQLHHWKERTLHFPLFDANKSIFSFCVEMYLSPERVTSSVRSANILPTKINSKIMSVKFSPPQICCEIGAINNKCKTSTKKQNNHIFIMASLLGCNIDSRVKGLERSRAYIRAVH